MPEPARTAYLPTVSRRSFSQSRNMSLISVVLVTLEGWVPSWPICQVEMSTWTRFLQPANRPWKLSEWLMSPRMDCMEMPLPSKLSSPVMLAKAARSDSGRIRWSLVETKVFTRERSPMALVHGSLEVS